jgi:hypothetical protein
MSPREADLLVVQLLSGRYRPGNSMRYRNCCVANAGDAGVIHTFANGLESYCKYAPCIGVLVFLARPHWPPPMPEREGYLASFMGDITGGASTGECLVVVAPACSGDSRAGQA